MCFLAEYILNNVLHGMCKRSYIALVSLVQYRYEMHSSCAVVHFISIYALQCRAYMARLHCVQNVMYYITPTALFLDQYHPRDSREILVNTK